MASSLCLRSIRLSHEPCYHALVLLLGFGDAVGGCELCVLRGSGCGSECGPSVGFTVLVRTVDIPLGYVCILCS